METPPSRRAFYEVPTHPTREVREMDERLQTERELEARALVSFGQAANPEKQCRRHNAVVLFVALIANSTKLVSILREARKLDC